MTREIYMDNAATTQMDKEVAEAMMPYMTENYGNPSSIHKFGRKTRAVIETARRGIAKLISCAPGEIFFTSGGTEADNMAISCAVRDLGVTRIVSSTIEHPAVLRTIEHLVEAGRVKVEHVNVMPNGHIDMEHLGELLQNDEKTLVSLMHANNEIGNRVSLTEISSLCKASNAYFHSDTVQTMGHYPFDMQELNIDFITCSAHKFHGPKGIGFLYVNENISIKPLMLGGSQERNMRGGTENLLGIVGLGKAMEIANRDVEEHISHVQGLKTYMLEKLEAEVEGVEFNGDPKGDSLYTVLSVMLPYSDKGEMMLYSLDIAGIACSGGSACSSGSNKGSHVLTAINSDMTRPSVRFSFCKFNTKEEVDYCVETLKKIYAVKVEE